MLNKSPDIMENRFIIYKSTDIATLFIDYINIISDHLNSQILKL